MTKIVATALALSIAIVIGIISAKAEEVASGNAPTYIETVRACGAEWRDRDDKAANKGMDAWQVFRAKCVIEKGFKSKRGR